MKPENPIRTVLNGFDKAENLEDALMPIMAYCEFLNGIDDNDKNLAVLTKIAVILQISMITALTRSPNIPEMPVLIGRMRTILEPASDLLDGMTEDEGC